MGYSAAIVTTPGVDNTIRPCADVPSLTLRPFLDAQVSPVLRVQNATGSKSWLEWLPSQQEAMSGDDGATAVTLAQGSFGGVLNITDGTATAITLLTLQGLNTGGETYLFGLDKAAAVTHALGVGFGNTLYLSNSPNYGSFDTPLQVNAVSGSTVDIIQATVNVSLGSSPVPGGVFNVDQHGDIRFERLSSTAASRPVARTDATYADNTDATRKGRWTLSAIDFAGTREALRIEADGSAARIGLFGHAAAAQPAAYTVSNPTPTRSFDEAAVTLTTLARVVGTLIQDLQSFGGVG